MCPTDDIVTSTEVLDDLEMRKRSRLHFSNDADFMQDPLRRRRRTLRDQLRIVQCEDRGPSTHMMEVLSWEPQYHTYIWQIDDDQRYGENVLKTMMLSSFI